MGMPVLRTDGHSGRQSLGQAVGRSVYGHVITRFSRMGRLLNFLTHGTPLARFARESSAINKHTKSPKRSEQGNIAQPTFLVPWDLGPDFFLPL